MISQTIFTVYAVIGFICFSIVLSNAVQHQGFENRSISVFVFMLGSTILAADLLAAYFKLF